MLIPSAAVEERSSAARVERGKVWAALVSVPGRLRDVPDPRETGLTYGGPAA
jgi:hypothetical protein